MSFQILELLFKETIQSSQNPPKLLVSNKNLS